MTTKLDKAARAARNQYMKDWRSQNKDKVKASNARYWAKKAAAIAAEKRKEEHNGNSNV